LEDIDCAFIKRKRASGREGGLTFSGLLNAIDGVASAEGRIIVMTTNHVERLDPALIRPGRADVKMLFDNATSEQAGRLFARFFPNHDGLADDFAELIADRRYSMATLQDYLMVHREDAQAALAQFDDIDRLEMNGPPAPIRRATKGAYRLPVPAATSDSPTSAAR
jgi:chaperone BCS1